MLNGKLTLERASNGWILSYGEDSVEVFTEAFECICRLSELLDMVSGPGAARILLDMAESSSSGHVDPATDPDVAQLAAPNTPATVATGD